MPHASSTQVSAKRVVSRSPEETRALAQSLLHALPPQAVVALHGELGSGKTCFVQGLALARGIPQAVTSPTFTIVNEYQGGIRPLYHIDLYRLRSPDEVPALGFDEYLEVDGITVIEWAERAGDLIPASAIHVTFEVLPNPDERLITFRQPA